MKLALAASLCLLLAAPLGAAHAQSQPPPPPPPSPAGPPPPQPMGSVQPAQPGYYGYVNPNAQRHVGLYFRGFFGLGATSMSADTEQEVSIGGFGGGLALALGGAVAENLILYGEIFDDIAINPTVKFGGLEADTEDVNAGVVAIGVGLAYYIMPMNLYVSGTLAAGQLTVQEDGDEIGESEFGPVLSLMVGKEWWVSDSWGLGLAAQLTGGSMKDDGSAESARWTVGAFAIGFTATYN